jgi:hypothetical protein
LVPAMTRPASSRDDACSICVRYAARFFTMLVDIEYLRFTRTLWKIGVDIPKVSLVDWERVSRDSWYQAA